MGNNRSLLMKGAAWIGLTRVLINLTGFASTIILARLLVPDDFGLVAIATSITLVIASITELSLAQALIQHDRPEEHHFHTAWTLNLARSVLLALLIACLAYPVALAYGDQRLTTVLLVLAATTIVGGLHNPKLVLFHRQLIFRQEFVLGVADKIAGFVAAVAIAVVFRSYWALIAGSIASQVTRVALSYVLLPYRPRLSVSGYREMLSFSIWLTLGKAVQTINWRSDPLLLGLFVNPTTLGYYFMGGRLAGLPLNESLGPVRQTLFPAFSRMQGNLPRMRSAYMRAQGLLCTIAFPIGAGFAAIADLAVRLLIGEKWLPAVPIIEVLTIVLALQAIESCQPLAMATGRTKALFGRDLRSFFIRWPCVIGGLLIGQATELGAIMGMVFGRGVASCINAVWNMQLVAQLIDLPLIRQFAVVVRPVVASAIMFAVIAALHRALPMQTADLRGFVALMGLVGAGAAAYAAMLASLWLAQGRPEGAETELIGMAKGLLAKASSAVGRSQRV